MAGHMRKSRRVMWCSHCAIWFVIPERDEDYRNVCPRCNRWLVRWRCTRCGHEWVPRNPDRPAKVCPGCRSMYWNRERTFPRDRAGEVAAAMAPQGPADDDRE